MAKILKDANVRAKYHHWLEAGIPYWRGRKYYFRKSESLSLFQTFLIVVGGFSFMQYIAQTVRYYQVKSGMTILERVRQNSPAGTASPPLSKSGSASNLASAASSSGAAPSRKQLKQQQQQQREQQRDQRKRASSGEMLLRSHVNGVFDDANLRAAFQYLAREHGVYPEVAISQSSWQAMLAGDGKDKDDVNAVSQQQQRESALRPPFPRPWQTLIFWPLTTVLGSFLVKKPSSKPTAEKTE